MSFNLIAPFTIVIDGCVLSFDPEMSVLVPAPTGDEVLGASMKAEDLLDKYHIAWSTHKTKHPVRVCVRHQTAKRWDLGTVFFVSVPFQLDAPLPVAVSQKAVEQTAKPAK